MTEPPNARVPIGRGRRIAGYIVIGLANALYIDVVWVVTSFGAGFGRAEWLRFAFWVWVATELLLAGCWLAFRSRAAAVAAIAGVVAPFAAVCLHSR